MKGRLLYYLVGRPGIRRSLTMWLMCRYRRTLHSSELLPGLRFIRTIQSPDHIVPDEATGEFRISSKAFSPSSTDGTLSGNLEQLLITDGLTCTDISPKLKRIVAVYSLTIEQFTAEALIVSHAPVKSNWYHGAVSGRFTDGIKRRLKNEAVAINPIDQVAAAKHQTRERSAGH